MTKFVNYAMISAGRKQSICTFYIKLIKNTSQRRYDYEDADFGTTK